MQINILFYSVQHFVLFWDLPWLLLFPYFSGFSSTSPLETKKTEFKRLFQQCSKEYNTIVMLKYYRPLTQRQQRARKILCGVLYTDYLENLLVAKAPVQAQAARRQCAPLLILCVMLSILLSTSFISSPSFPP